MLNDVDAKQKGLDKITAMLKDGQAKRLGGLVKKSPALEVHALKVGVPAAEGSPEEEASETPEEAAVEGDEHPVHASVMKLMDRLIRPKKS